MRNRRLLVLVWAVSLAVGVVIEERVAPFVWPWSDSAPVSVREPVDWIAGLSGEPPPDLGHLMIAGLSGERPSVMSSLMTTSAQSVNGQTFVNSCATSGWTTAVTGASAPTVFMTGILMDPARTAAEIAILSGDQNHSGGQDHRSWHLFTQSYGGTVTLLRDLTKHECEFARASALGPPATPTEEEQNRRLHPPCPRSGESLDDWHKAYPDAHGCADPDGNGSTSWTGHLVWPGDIRSAECFE